MEKYKMHKKNNIDKIICYKFNDNFIDTYLIVIYLFIYLSAH